MILFVNDLLLSIDIECVFQYPRFLCSYVIKHVWFVTQSKIFTFEMKKNILKLLVRAGRMYIILQDSSVNNIIQTFQVRQMVKN